MATTIQPTKPAFWRNIRFLRVAGQVLFVAIALIVGRELFLNLVFSVERQNIDLSFDFIRERAGFDIKEGIDYSPNDSALTAYVVAVMNTIRVALVGIVLATLLGLVMGVARLSPNWLVRKIAQVYVEVIRNTPVLLQIIFFFVVVVLALPLIGAGSIGGVAFLSNRGAAVPWPKTGAGVASWYLFLLAGLLAAALVRRWRTRVNERTGEPHHRVLWALGTLLPVAVIGYVLTGGPVRIDVPEQIGRGYEGGLQVSGEYAALLIALVIYTGAFIAEIVRGSILAVPRGQKEAAEALGLTPLQQLRFVVLPQALRIAIPPINSQYLNLTKNSSLGLAIGYPEIVSVSSTLINQKGRQTQMLLIVMGTYLALSLLISLVMNLLNRAVSLRGERR